MIRGYFTGIKNQKEKVIKGSVIARKNADKTMESVLVYESNDMPSAVNRFSNRTKLQEVSLFHTGKQRHTHAYTNLFKVFLEHW